MYAKLFMPPPLPHCATIPPPLPLEQFSKGNTALSPLLRCKGTEITRLTYYASKCSSAVGYRRHSKLCHQNFAGSVLLTFQRLLTSPVTTTTPDTKYTTSILADTELYTTSILADTELYTTSILADTRLYTTSILADTELYTTSILYTTSTLELYTTSILADTELYTASILADTKLYTTSTLADTEL